MMQNNRSFNLFLTLFAAFSLWCVWYFAVRQDSDIPTNPNRPSEFVQQVKVTVMGKTGHWSYQFFSPSALHYTKDNRTAFTAPRLNFYQENAPIWQAQAERGEAINGNEEVRLFGAVKLSQARGLRNLSTDITTDTAVIYPDKRIITTQDKVIALRPDAKITGVGMKMNMDQQTLELLSQVNGFYHPKNNKPISITSHSAQIVKNKISELGTTVFLGDVKMLQDTSTLVTPELTVYTDKNNQISKAVAKGPGTRYTNLKDPHKPPFDATALEIDYLPLTDEIVLLGNAKAQQGINSYSAPEIHYHIDKESVITRQGRIKMVILPDSFKKQENPS